MKPTQCLMFAALIAAASLPALWHPSFLEAGAPPRPPLARPSAHAVLTTSARLLTALRQAGAARDPLRHEQPLGDLFQQLAEHSPPEAAAYLDSLPDSHPLADGWTLTLAALWTRKDMDAALQWLATLPNARRGIMAMECVISSNPAPHLPKIAGIVQKLPPGEDRTRLVSTLGIQWQRQDPGAASRWALSLKDTAAAVELLKNSLPAWLEQSPVRASQFVLQLPPMLRAHNDVLGPLLDSWMRHDPAAALAWVSDLPDDIIWSTALVHVSPHLSGPELQAALAHGGALPETQDKDRLLGALALRWARDAPAQAAVLAASLPDESVRTTTLTQVIAQWSQHAPLPAADFVASLSDPALQQHVLQSLLQVWPSGDKQSLLRWIEVFPAPTRSLALSILNPPPQDSGR